MRSARTTTVLTCVLAFAAGVGAARADGLPPGPCSDLPTCIRVSPDGQLTVSGTVRTVTCEPVVNQPVRLVVSPQCMDLRLCPDVPSPFVLSTLTDADGDFVFAPAAGGCCAAPGAMEIHADPGDVTIAVYDAVGSPDSGGNGTSVADLVVNLNDFSRFSQGFLTQNPCFDYTVENPDAADTCDGDVRLADFAAFSRRFLATCP